MNDKKSFLKIFMLLALIQAAVGAYMIFDDINLSKEGKEFKFKCYVNTDYNGGNFLNVCPINPSCEYSEKLTIVEKRRKKTKGLMDESFYRDDVIPVQFGNGKDGYAKAEAYGDNAQKPCLIYMSPFFYCEKDDNGKPIEKPYITFSWQNLDYPLKEFDNSELGAHLAKIDKAKNEEFKVSETKRLGREVKVEDLAITPPYCDVYIKIKNGKAMLSKLVIDGVPAEELAKKFPRK